MRAYHRVDPLMDERKSHYTPAQFGAFLKVQLVAGRQKQRGWFRSLAALRGTLPSAYARLLDFLVAEGDLVIEDDGRVYVDGWQEWQEGDLTVADRMRALRNRRRNGTVTRTVTAPVTEPSPTAIRSSVGVSTSVGTPPSPPLWSDERLEEAWFLTGRRRPPSKAQLELIEGYLGVFDKTGVERAVRLFLEHPDDPIGAIKGDLAVFREERKAEAKRGEEEAAERHRVERSERPGVKRTVEYLRQFQTKEGA